MIARVLMVLGLLSLIEPLVYPRERVRVVYVVRDPEPCSCGQCAACLVVHVEAEA